MKISPQAREEDTFVINSGEGRKIDVMQSEKELRYYRDQEDFINATDNFSDVKLQLKNDFDPGIIMISNKLNKELGDPDQVKMFRKGDNLFLKPE